jgi:hypothetical protein
MTTDRPRSRALAAGGLGLLLVIATAAVVEQVAERLATIQTSWGAPEAVLLVPSRPIPSGALLVETFNSSLDALWTKGGGADKFARLEGLQFLIGDSADSRRGARLISRQAFESRPGLVLATVVRPTLERASGPSIGFRGGSGQGIVPMVGWSGGQIGGRNAWAPLAGVRVSTNPEWADNYDALLVTVLRQQGFLNLIAGGPLATLPEARLVHVGSSSVSAPHLHVELRAEQASTAIETVFVGMLQVEDAAIATVLDSFQRREAAGLGQPEKGSNGWQVITGDWVADGQARPLGEGFAVIDTGQLDGWIEATVRTPPGGPFHAGIVFDAVDATNFWRWTGSDDRVQLVQVVDGVETMVYETGAIALRHDTVHRLAARIRGRELSLLVDDADALPAGPLVRDRGAEGVDAGLWSGGDGISFPSFAAWPEVVRLPDDWRPLLRPAPGPVADPQVVDTFGDPMPPLSRTRAWQDQPRQNPHAGVPETAPPLSTLLPGEGANLTEVFGRWRIADGAATVDRGPGLALVTVGALDMAAEVTVRLPRGGSASLVLRALEFPERLEAQLSWQDGSPELALFETVGSSGRFINAVSLAGRFGLGEERRLRFAAVGREVAAYLDGQLVVQGTMSDEAFRRLDTRGVGLLVEGDAPAQFRDFQAGPAR